METRTNEQTIYIKDLLFVALRRWRAVIAVALILGVLCGAAQFLISTQKDPADVDAEYQTALEDYERDHGSLTAKVDVLKETLRTQQIYIEESVFMKLNPYNFYEATLCLYVDTGYQIDPNLTLQDPDKTAAVLAAYESVFLSDDTIALIAKAYETTPQYAAEMVRSSSLADSGTVTIAVRCLDEKIGSAVLKVLESQVANAHAAVSSSVTEHTVQVLNKDVVSSVNLALVTQQTDVINRIATQQKALKETEQQLAALVEPQKAAFSVTKLLLMFAVGAVLGGLLTVAALWVLHIISEKVYSAKTLKDHTGIKVLGCLPGNPGKTALDQWLQKKEGRCLADSKEQIALTAARIRNHCGEYKHILLTGSISAEAREELLQALQTAMPATQFTNAENICKSASAQDALALCDAAILVEQCGVSKYETVIRQTEILTDCGKTIIGCILIDN